MCHTDIRARYERAKAMDFNFNPSSSLVKNDAVLPCWIKGSKSFFYIRYSSKGKSYRLVDAETGTNKTAFDHAALAEALAKVSGKVVDAENLPIIDIRFYFSPLTLTFSAYERHWLFDIEAGVCALVEEVHWQKNNAYGNDTAFYPLSLASQVQYYLESPCGSSSVFFRNYNLWSLEHQSGIEHQLTDCGEKDYAFGGGLVDGAVPAVWSTDGRHVMTGLWDYRNSSVQTLDITPSDDSRWRVNKGFESISNSENLNTMQLVVIDTVGGKMSVADYPPMMQLPVLGTRLPGHFRAKMAWWSNDGQLIYFLDVLRGAKAIRLVEWNIYSSVTRVLFEEVSETFMTLTHSLIDFPEFMVLPDTNELIWFSERSGWAHLYLYDFKTGRLKHAITEGEWLVRNILHFEASTRELLLHTAGREVGKNPYYRDICKVNIDTGELIPLASGNVDYCVYRYMTDWVGNWTSFSRQRGDIASDCIHGISPCGQYLVATRSRIDTVPESVLIDRDGNEILSLEVADVSGLPVDWRWPEPVQMKGADNQTNIFGAVFRPPGHSPENRYPIVEYCSSSRLLPATPTGSFSNSSFCGSIYHDCISLAALGFIVVVMDGRGTPLRDKAFLDHHHGEFYYTSDFDDRIVGIRQLAKRDPSIDLDRVGILSTENLTNAAYALLKHPDFYKVGVLHCPYDPRSGSASVQEPADGLLSNSTGIYPEAYAKNLAGKLFLILGLQSPHLQMQFRLIEALQSHNKEFDMLCLPRMGHAMVDYSIRKGWDYLVKHMLDMEPPKDFKLESTKERIMSMSASKSRMKSVMKNLEQGD